MEKSSNSGLRGRFEWGEVIVFGSQSVACNKSLAKSVHNSEKAQNSFEQGDPRKEYCKLGRANSLFIMEHFSSVSLYKLTL
jgi:hypothetical protein